MFSWFWDSESIASSLPSKKLFKGNPGPQKLIISTKDPFNAHSSKANDFCKTSQDYQLFRLLLPVGQIHVWPYVCVWAWKLPTQSKRKSCRKFSLQSIWELNEWLWFILLLLHQNEENCCKWKRWKKWQKENSSNKRETERFMFGKCLFLMGTQFRRVDSSINKTWTEIRVRWSKWNQGKIEAKRDVHFLLLLDLSSCVVGIFHLTFQNDGRIQQKRFFL